jgi:hypothetical protein
MATKRDIIKGRKAKERRDMAAKRDIIQAERIERSILLIRGEKIILDIDLAAVYGVATKALNQAIKRNAGRFPISCSG